ncbi:MAG: translation elongation factor Ts [Anaerolineae bacterium]|nr:translation elongation factor Ts [Anaerolineae bacterium]MCB9132350.1 translation elongation factor Ts [Anaerolineales bacterium]MCB0233488.1 translation elongation factor Ts [Anaerolineae bacterium]MCB0249459.1 translation elongation factor Ts [Anaerolineae bacterium]MCB9142214.1 translation elongation factor Ts [Anaerolineales bacterium]
MATSSEQIKQLREQTGAGVLDCKRALDETNGSFEKAVEILRNKGLAAAAKKADRDASEGLIGNYVHMGSKVAAIVEVNCESDFVARTEQFQTLTRDLAMQIVATSPLYVRREEVPAEIADKQRAVYREELVDSDKPADIIEKIVEGKLDKYFKEICLLEQPFIKDGGVSVGDLVTDSIAKLGENIVVRRFARLEVGE